MRLFHTGDVETDRLVPMIGERRHGDETAEAVDVPVVWLSSLQQTYAEGGKPFAYRYEVEIPADDPALHEDGKVAVLGARMNSIFGTTQINRWYYLTRSVAVVATEKWDPESGRYVTVPIPDGKDA